MAEDRLSYTVLEEIGFRLLAEGKTICIRAQGFSMYPTVKPGSVIFIEPFEKGPELVPGEIIAWKKNKGFVVHRLVRFYEEGNNKFFVTRGDSSNIEDEAASSNSVAGRVIKIEDSEGKVIPADILFNKKPNYTLNRFLVKIILQISRVKRIFHILSPLKGSKNYNERENKTLQKSP